MTIFWLCGSRRMNNASASSVFFILVTRLYVGF